MAVLCYGIEVFTWSDDSLIAFTRAQHVALKRCLGCGGRALGNTVECITVLDSCLLEWNQWHLRLLRLVNAQSDSRQHSTLVNHKTKFTDWYDACFQDFLTRVPSNVRIPQVSRTLFILTVTCRMSGPG